MFVIAPTWEGIPQPPDEKTEVFSLYSQKYRFLQAGLELLLGRIDAAKRTATSLGLKPDVYEEDETYVGQMVEWGIKRLSSPSSIIESTISFRSFRYLKAGLLLLILQRRATNHTGISPRAVQEFQKETAAIESLSEEKQFRGLKPADILFDFVETAQPNAVTMTQQTPPAARLLMYCYCHEDKTLRDNLEKHLSALRHDGLIQEWHDRKIHAGDEWDREIDKKLSAADIVLLLVSASFLNSRYCYSVELKRSIERHENGECRVIPVILRDCDWQSTPLGKLQAVPTDGKAVTGRAWKNTHEAFTDVARRIRDIVGLNPPNESRMVNAACGRDVAGSIVQTTWNDAERTKVCYYRASLNIKTKVAIPDCHAQLIALREDSNLKISEPLTLTFGPNGQPSGPLAWGGPLFLDLVATTPNGQALIATHRFVLPNLIDPSTIFLPGHVYELDVRIFGTGLAPEIHTFRFEWKGQWDTADLAVK